MSTASILSSIKSLPDPFPELFGFYYLHLKSGQLVPPILRLRNPTSINDKIIHLKRKVRHSDSRVLADKIAVREYVAKRVGEMYLVPLHGEWSRAEDIDFGSLPDRFVLKPNHGSGMVHLCQDKANEDCDELRRTAAKWLSTDYYRVGREYQYRGIRRVILAEMMLSGVNGDVPDYKFFCFHGKPRFVQVDVGRHTNHQRSFYDMDWNRMPFSWLYPNAPEEMTKPENFDEMKNLAARLSAALPFIRVDLYESNEKVYFGELTFHHGGGFEPIWPRWYGKHLGRLLTLEEA